MKKIDKIIFGFAAVAVSWGFFGQSVCANEASGTLRVCNWEEYIDLGEWDEEEAIELENGKVILGERPLYEDFEDWSIYELQQRTELVQEFDQLADDIVAEALYIAQNHSVEERVVYMPTTKLVLV